MPNGRRVMCIAINRSPSRESASSRLGVDAAECRGALLACGCADGCVVVLELSSGWQPTSLGAGDRTSLAAGDRTSLAPRWSEMMTLAPGAAAASPIVHVAWAADGGWLYAATESGLLHAWHMHA